MLNTIHACIHPTSQPNQSCWSLNTIHPPTHSQTVSQLARNPSTQPAREPNQSCGSLNTIHPSIQPASQPNQSCKPQSLTLSQSIHVWVGGLVAGWQSHCGGGWVSSWLAIWMNGWIYAPFIHVFIQISWVLMHHSLTHPYSRLS